MKKQTKKSPRKWIGFVGNSSEITEWSKMKQTKEQQQMKRNLLKAKILVEKAAELIEATENLIGL